MFKEKSKRIEQALENVFKKPIAELEFKKEALSDRCPPEIVTEEIVESLAEVDEYIGDVNDNEMEYKVAEESPVNKINILPPNELCLQNIETTEIKAHPKEEQQEAIASSSIEILEYPLTFNDVNVCGICGKSFETSNNLGMYLLVMF